jgi:hypothetical protein
METRRCRAQNSSRTNTIEIVEETSSRGNRILDDASSSAEFPVTTIFIGPEKVLIVDLAEDPSNEETFSISVVATLVSRPSPIAARPEHDRIM